MQIKYDYFVVEKQRRAYDIMNISKLHFTFNDKRCIICVNENLINKYRDRLDFTIYIYKGGI